MVDVVTGDIELVSRTDTGGLACGWCAFPAIDGTGRHVAWFTRSTMVATPEDHDVYSDDVYLRVVR
jgi:hypothetical protein